MLRSPTLAMKEHQRNLKRSFAFTNDSRNYTVKSVKSLISSRYDETFDNANVSSISPRNPRVLTAMMKDNLFNILNNGGAMKLNNSKSRSRIEPSASEASLAERSSKWLKAKNEKIRRAKK